MPGIFTDLEKKSSGVFDDLTKEPTGEGVFDDLTVKTTLPEAPSLEVWSPSLKERIRNKITEVLEKSPFYEPGKRLGQLGIHYLAEAASGLGLYIPDIIASKISEEDTLAEALDTLTGFTPTPREVGAGEAAKFITSLSTVGAAVGPVIAKIPAKIALKTILASGVTFGTRATVEEIAQKISTGDPIDIEGIHFEGGIGVLFGAGAVGVSKFVKFISKFRALPKAQVRPARAEVNAAAKHYAKTGDRTRWDAVRIKYGGIKPEVLGYESVGGKIVKKAPPPVKEFGKYPLAKMKAPGARPPAARAAKIPEEDIIAAAYYEDKIVKIESALRAKPDDKVLHGSLVIARRGLLKATGKIAPAAAEIEKDEITIAKNLGFTEKEIAVVAFIKNRGNQVYVDGVPIKDWVDTKEIVPAVIRTISIAGKEWADYNLSANWETTDNYWEIREGNNTIIKQMEDAGLKIDVDFRVIEQRAKTRIITAVKPPAEPEPTNAYLRMPLELVKEDAANGVKLAKDALIDLQEIIVTPASIGQKNKIIRTAVGRGLEQKHLIALSKQITGIEDIDALTSEDADDLLKALDNYRYMDTWKTESITKEPDKLVDPSMSKTQMAGIRKAAGSTEAYNKSMIYSQKLGGVPKNPNVPDIDGRRALWYRDMLNHSRYLRRETARQIKKEGEANILNPYQSISYALDKAERRTGIPLRRQWSNMVSTVKGWNYKNEEQMWTAIRNAKVHRLGIVTNKAKSTKIANWLNEEDEALRLNMWNDMSSKTQALAVELDSMLQEYAPFLVRWGRFLVWDRHARIGEEILNKLHREGKTPTDKQISKAQKLMREKKPPDAPVSALSEGRAARDIGQLAEWLDTQEWGTRKRYYMSEGRELAGDIYEGSISEEIFGKAPEAGELTTEAPSELKARRAKGAPIISTNAALDVLRHLDRLSAFASTYEQRMSFWEAFRSTNPNKEDLGMMRDADRALRGIMPKTLPIIKSFRDVNRFFWRSHLVFDPSGSLWFAWRQLLQNVAFDPSQFNMVELGKSIRSFSDMSKARDWMKNNPDAAEKFIDYWNRTVSEDRSFYRHFIMKSEEAGGLEMTSKAGTLIDMLAITPGVTDKGNRKAVWPLAYDIVQRNIKQFRDGKLSAQGLWNRLALNTITPGQSMEMMSLLENEDYSEFMSRYAEYKTENVNFRYNPLLRSLQEMTPTGRVTLGLLTFPRGVMNIAIKNGLEPIADYAHNPTSKNARRAYDGFKTLIKLFAGTSIAQSLSLAITGVSAYGLWKLIFGPSLLAPGFGKVVELLDENAFILHQAEQKGEDFHTTAAKMVANGAKNLEMFIPLAEVMKRGYEVQKNRDGVYLYDLAIKYAKEEYLKQYQKPFDYRNRELHEKIQYMVFGKEQPKGKKIEWKKSFNLERSKKW